MNWAFVSHFGKKDVLNFLNASLIGGILVALWAIPEHFGYSPSCAVLVGRISADCWVQDVQSRVFATLGQPNWLAAYMGMLIFPGIYFFLAERDILKKSLYYMAVLLFYLAFTFTFSRGGMLGVLGGLGVFGVLIAWEIYKAKSTWQIGKAFAVIATTLLAVNLLFGSALTGSFRLIKGNAPPPRPSLTGSGGGTQLENGGTESGQIRLIVWKGAWEIFKHYPVFGSGVETFAYSYYMFRPVEHNLVSEWDFLYNKAHNEYLNYLATTGAVGFISYILFIGVFIVWGVSKIYSFHFAIFSQKSIIKFSKIKNSETIEYLFIGAMLGSYVSYLIQNFFGFSVVMIAVLFYLIPALAFAFTENTAEVTSIPSFLNIFRSVFSKLYGYSLVLKILVVLAIFTIPVIQSGILWGVILGGILLGIVLVTKKWQAFTVSLAVIFLIGGILNLWRADVNYKLGSDASDAGSATKAYNSLLTAYDLNPREPLYQSDFGNVAASAAVSLQDTDATQAAELKNQAITFTDHALSSSPANVSLWRTAIRTYYVLSVMDSKYDAKTIEVIDKAISLAPTDPKLYYNKALILSQQNDQGSSSNKKTESIEVMKKAIELKPNYREAKLSLADLYLKNNQKDQAIEVTNQVLKAIPNDPDALKVLEEATTGGGMQ